MVVRRWRVGMRWRVGDVRDRAVCRRAATVGIPEGWWRPAGGALVAAATATADLMRW